MTPGRLRSIRAGFMLTQAQLARVLGRSRVSVSHWENGKNPIPPTVARFLLALLLAAARRGRRGRRLIFKALTGQHADQLFLAVTAPEVLADSILAVIWDPCPQVPPGAPVLAVEGAAPQGEATNAPTGPTEPREAPRVVAEDPHFGPMNQDRDGEWGHFAIYATDWGDSPDGSNAKPLPEVATGTIEAQNRKGAQK